MVWVGDSEVKVILQNNGMEAFIPQVRGRAARFSELYRCHLDPEVTAASWGGGGAGARHSYHRWEEEAQFSKL